MQKILILADANTNTNSDLLKVINRQSGMKVEGVSPQPQTVLQQLNVLPVGLILVLPEAAGLSLMDTRTFLDNLACIPDPPVVFLCSNYRELATHRVCSYWLPKGTDGTLLAKRIRTFAFSCISLREQMKVESLLLNIGLIPGYEGFRCLRDTILLLIHAPAAAKLSLESIFRDVAAIRGSSCRSVSQAIRFCARNLFAGKNVPARVRKYFPEVAQNMETADQTFPTTLNFVRMLTDQLKSNKPSSQH